MIDHFIDVEVAYNIQWRCCSEAQLPVNLPYFSIMSAWHGSNKYQWDCRWRLNKEINGWSGIWVDDVGHLTVLQLYCSTLAKLQVRNWKKGIDWCGSSRLKTYLDFSQSWLLWWACIGAHMSVCFLVSGTSLVMTVIRSIGNDHRDLTGWCWSQTGRTGKASFQRH